ncbi:hypothetical protein CEY00_Acc30337 [Actinidia chinensis var. chinensis]|uniref:RING-type domain-containing protein n=1 Tax=Actinidia chinensis var. chinensis TaxID=1590841 RepID=A0A2R6PFR4_ACTCC|nr:hypothetical protein CEY00_Acc30337 [Actinidia chinensis var. chinensis]
MTTAVEIDGQQLTDALANLSILEQREIQSTGKVEKMACENHHGICAICLNKIVLQETALVKGCEHAYCVTCILRWATYKERPTCPQCKHPFEFLNVHRSLDGSIHDYMYEESVCLLLRASWFMPLIVEDREELSEEVDDYYPYEEEDLDEEYYSRSSSLRIGNRRWGDNGYVRAGRQEARPMHRPNTQNLSAGPSSREPKKESVVKDAVGRRAKRALKREAADKAAAAKHELHLVRLGRK